MAATINTNLISLNAQRNQSVSQSSLATSMQRLSSGLRVNSAKDDAAGLAISERMNAQAKGMNVAIRNANDGISMAQTAEGALSKTGDILQRMRELAVQAANGSNNGADKDSLNKEFEELGKEITRTISSTSFNDQKILAGGVGTAGTVTFQVGANTETDVDTIDVTFTDMSTDASLTAVTTGATNKIDSTVTDVGAVIDALDEALDKVNSERAVLGATQSRFDAVISNLQVSSENQSAARGRIVDADFAAETANLSRSQVLQQAGNAMIAQANQLPQQVLSLLR
ncbi:flagellin [Sphaerotilus microaerophilus]|jgi:flagellin|uniref:Flagellin n=1 Tax=Sphaerotilus microaerophilus TaxID=2914710 RepID=A0ABM7YJG2_9BURK|nr:flagellin [Sphaerotilus sp. FB-5]BDI04448.1 flagellin [Sphaerotilus sp. FB-5]